MNTDLGQMAYLGYCVASQGHSLIDGSPLPAWDKQAPEIQEAWRSAARYVLEAHANDVLARSEVSHTVTGPTPGLVVKAGDIHGNVTL